MEQKTQCLTRILLITLLSMFALVHATAQTTPHTITGSVYDELNEPVIGASVALVGSTNGTFSNENGDFTLSDVPTDAQVRISFMGYISQTVTIKNSKKLSIFLKEDIQTLEDVVVVGYGVQRKSDLTGAVTSVKPSDALKSAPSANIADALQGRLSGVSILSGSGDPSKENTIRIRGMNSMAGDQGPLIVVDGFIGGSLQTLNPSDIESIEVLKDASATAVYGSRGANGVVLVTTKLPKDKMVVNFNSFISIKTIAKKPDILSPYETAKLANAYGKEYNESIGSAPKVYYSDAELDDFKNGKAGFDYFDAIINDPALTQNYELSISNAGTNSSILASVRYNKDEGIIEKNYKEMFNYRLKADLKIKPWLEAGLNFSGFYRHHTGPRLTQYNGVLIGAMYFPNIVGPYDKNGNYNNKYPIGGGNSYNPLGHINEANNKNKRLNNNLQGYLNFKIFDGLTFRTQLGVDFNNTTSTDLQNKRSYYASVNGEKAQGTANSKESTEWLNTNILSYVKEFNADHRINATAVYEQSQIKWYSHKSQANNLDFPDQLGVNALGWGNANESRVASQKVIGVMQSWMLRANYVFKNRYMITSSIRGDGSSRLAKKWAYFPSVALAWDIKQETFMKNLTWMDQLKLRAGYGSVGNQAIDDYQIYAAMDVDYDSNGKSIYNQVSIDSRHLKWEKNNQINIGLDMAFLNGRVTLNLDWYNKKTKNLLLTVERPSHTGPNIVRNSGELKNTGLEVTIGADPLVTKDWNWHTDVTLSFNKGKFTKIPTLNKSQIVDGQFENQIMRMIEGQKIGSFWGHQYQGVWQEEDVKAPFIGADGKTNGKTMGQVYNVVPGNARYKDENLDGKINNDDMGIIGNGQPTFNWGWNNTFSYKNFDLSLLVVGFHGFDIYNATDHIGYGSVSGQNMDNITPKKALLNRWTKDNTNTNIPGFAKNKNALKSFTSQFVEKGSFIKMKNITVGYSLPNSICRAVRINNLRIYASVHNLFTITDYTGMDPESTLGNPLTTGTDWGAYPNSRDYLFGLSFSF